MHLAVKLRDWPQKGSYAKPHRLQPLDKLDMEYTESPMQSQSSYKQSLGPNFSAASLFLVLGALRVHTEYFTYN